MTDETNLDLETFEALDENADGVITKEEALEPVQEDVIVVEDKPKKASTKKSKKTSKKKEETKVAEDAEVEAVVSEPSPEEEITKTDKTEEHRKLLRKAQQARKEGKMSAAVRWRRLGRR